MLHHSGSCKKRVSQTGLFLVVGKTQFPPAISFGFSQIVCVRALHRLHPASEDKEVDGLVEGTDVGERGRTREESGEKFWAAIDGRVSLLFFG